MRRTSDEVALNDTSSPASQAWAASRPLSREDMSLVFGRQELIEPTSNLDRYGFSRELACYAGLKAPRRPFCSWIHGWIWWDEIVEIEDLLGPRQVPRGLSVVVGSPRQALVLEAAGYTRVVIGGVPFIYVPVQQVARQPGTLLAFLAHSAEAERFDVLHRDYLDYLASIRNEFEEVYVSVFALDRSEKLLAEITRRGLRVLDGANPSDRHSMRRTRRALEYFEHVSTNTMGSQVGYALAAGCRTSIWSPIYRYDYGILANSAHGLSRSYVERTAHVHSEEYLRMRFPELFDAPPTSGHLNPGLGSELLGVRYRLTPTQVMEAAGWTASAQFSGYLMGAARRSYRQVRSLFALLPNSAARRCR